VARLEAKVEEGVSASSRYVLYMWKMLGWALTERNKAGVGAALVRPADVPPFCHFHRYTDLPLQSEPMKFFLLDPVLMFHLIVMELLPSALLSEPALTVQWMLNCVALLSVNTISLTNGGGTLGPQALMGSASFFNHSCMPNVADHVSPNGMIAFMAKRDIAAGEELFISYVGEDAPREQRQQRLSMQYGFACHCEKCNAEAARE
jgi:hypothetical protein